MGLGRDSFWLLLFHGERCGVRVWNCRLFFVFIETKGKGKIRGLGRVVFVLVAHVGCFFKAKGKG